MTLANRIMIATDFSQHSEAAARYAVSLARDRGAVLMTLHVIQPPPPYGAEEPFLSTLVSQDENLLQQILEETLPEDCAVEHTSHLLVGRPAEEILRFAAEHDVNLIVLGTHGRTGAARMLAGSVAEAVIRGAACPVLTIRQPFQNPEGQA